MYEQLTLFDLDLVTEKPLFEQIFTPVKNPVILCVNCLCRYCTHNAEEVHHSVAVEEAISAVEPCFICDECLEYTGEAKHQVCQKKDCKNFIMSEFGAKRNRKRIKLIT